MLRLQEKYNKEVIPALKEKIGCDTVMRCPKIEKVVINIGVGRMAKESEIIKTIQKDLSLIAGQHPALVSAKKSIASFKARKGAPSGLKVTLRGKRMYDFLSRFIDVALPRSRDFRGIDRSSVDKDGNFNIGIKEHIIFPETSSDNIRQIFGMQITVVSSAKSKEHAEQLFRLMGFPLKKSE